MNDAELGKAIRHLVTAWVEWGSTVKSRARTRDHRALADFLADNLADN